MKLLTFNTKVFVGALSLMGSASAVVISNTEAVDLFALSKSSESQTVVTQSIEEDKAYILHGMRPDAIKDAVSKVGGVVSKEFPIISAVSAVLSNEQVSELGEYKNLRVSEDRSVRTESVGEQFIVDTLITTQTKANQLHRYGIKGDGVKVAVLDSGILLSGEQGSHLRYDSHNRGRVWAKYDAIEGAQNRRLDDDHNGHGSHVTGIIASSLRDENGHYNGMAPDAELISIRAFDEDGNGSYSQVLDGLNWVYENRWRYNIRVLNLSLGAEVQSVYWHDPINLAVMRLWDAGVVVVTSAGNSGSDFGTVSVPGNNPYIITVGAATDNYTPFDYSDDRMTTFSSQGPTFEGFVKPDIVSYGGHVNAKFNSTLGNGRYKKLEGAEDYYSVSGTSQAAAVVTGAVALMLQYDPSLTPDDVKCRLISTARSDVKSAEGIATPFAQGAGMLDAYSAVTSRERGCANKGLDIKADLDGVQHFKGPTRIDDTGNMLIELSDGDIQVEGNPWDLSRSELNGNSWDGSSSLQGNPWDITELFSAPWNGTENPWDGTPSLEGNPWDFDGFSLEGNPWDISDISLKGNSWEDIFLQGNPWENTNEVLLESNPWDHVGTRTESHDSEGSEQSGGSSTTEPSEVEATGSSDSAF
ncbi:hypothetical protein EYS14_11580 [Alteromonadaceae bacterium M269]|nr:hypothetical protein EYS14_11580 [Alteromonadaceae bacterium M269]